MRTLETENLPSIALPTWFFAATSGSVGTEVNLEKDLGIRGSDRFRVDLNWRMTGRQYLPGKRPACDRHQHEGVCPVYEYAFMQRDDWDLLGSFGAQIFVTGTF
jgi:hypothetical protein